MAVNVVNPLVDAVNIALQMDGERRVTSVTDLSPAAEDVVNLLKSNLKDFLMLGHSFNTELHFLIRPNVQKYIVVPANVLAIDVADSLKQTYPSLTARDGRLYDYAKNTFIFENDVVCDIIWHREFDDCPPHIQQVVKYDTVRMYMLTRDASLGLLSKLDKLYDKAKMDFDRVEMRLADYNVFERPSVAMFLDPIAFNGGSSNRTTSEQLYF